MTRHLNFYLKADENDDESYEDESDSEFGRDARSRNSDPTFPPFPGYDDDYDKFVTYEPETSPPLVVPTTSERIIYENEIETEEPVHKKVVPWLKRQWGLTKDFVKKHYDRIGG